MALELTRGQRRRLSRWARGGTVPERLSQRAAMVLACAEGRTQREVAQAFDVSAHLVGRWCRRFKRDGTLALLDIPRPGRRPAGAGSAAELVATQLAAGVFSTHALAARCQISQPTASRIRRMFALDPTRVELLPVQLRLVHPHAHQPLGMLLAVGVRLLVLGPPALERYEFSGADLKRRLAEVVRQEAATTRRLSGVKLRRFLRGILRAHPSPLLLVAHTSGQLGPAVRRLLEKHPRLSWHAVGTNSNWEEVVNGWLRSRSPNDADSVPQVATSERRSAV